MSLRVVSFLSNHHDATAAGIAHLVGDRLGIEAHFVDVPHSARRRFIENGSAHEVWMCGFLTRRLFDKGLAADIVAAPVFTGERGPVYRTLVVVAADSSAQDLADLRDGRLVINEEESWSGHHALIAHLVATGVHLPFFGEVTESGSHSASLQRVLRGEADCTALDSSIWDLLPPEDRGRLRVLARTRDWPAPPFSIASHLDTGLRSEIVSALTSVDQGGTVEAIAVIGKDAYDGMTPHGTLLQ